jgi:hypothetical protein
MGEKISTRETIDQQFSTVLGGEREIMIMGGEREKQNGYVIKLNALLPLKKGKLKLKRKHIWRRRIATGRKFPTTFFL